MRSSLHALPVLQDNIVWIWERDGKAVVVDPAVAEPVQSWLEQRNLSLVAVLQTHHHSDHIGGTPALLERWPAAEVIAAASDRQRIPFQTISVGDGDAVPLLGRQVQVMDVAAHTATHIAFLLPEGEDLDLGPVLFCGDTLFSAGCGRLMEGTPADMHRAMQRLAGLPDRTQVCCAHEYTESNLRWALHHRPGNEAIASRYRDVVALRRRGDLSLPSSIGAERRINLFLMAESAEQLAELRHHKDHWRAP